MGLLDDLQPPLKQTPCKVRSVLNDLSEVDKEKLISAVANDAWSPQKLALALRAKGVELGSDSIRKHRRKGCSC